jgi:SAM-dependent methyltransferase
MKSEATWAPTKYVMSRGRLRGSRDATELGIGSRLISDLVADHYDRDLPRHATGRLLDLGCGKVPLYAAYAPHVTEITCVDWGAGEHIDVHCDLSQPLPFDDARFDTIILSDVLEHIAEPDLLWREMTRILAPGGRIVMNVPFYYSIHAHPHDYYRYTNFALERFVQINGLKVLDLVAVGGVIEIFGDLTAKALSKGGPIGGSLAAFVQAVVLRFGRTRLGARILRVSSRHFPLGYFMIAQRPA